MKAAGVAAAALGKPVCVAIVDISGAMVLFERFGEKTFFATLDEAVSAYLATRPVDWIDWEDRTP